MKLLVCLLIIITSLSGFSQQEKKYELDLQKSTINWKGSYLFKFSEHTGTVKFKKGHLITSGGNITGGTFVIDMTTITNEEFEKGIGPVEHLRNKDFFDVKVFTEATLKLTKVTYYSNTNEHRFEGDLTIKGISNPIMIKATVDEAIKIITTKFKIDRKDWGINYKSIYKDSAISDAIEFDITLKF